MHTQAMYKNRHSSSRVSRSGGLSTPYAPRSVQAHSPSSHPSLPQSTRPHSPYSSLSDPHLRHYHRKRLATPINYQRPQSAHNGKVIATLSVSSE